MLNTFVIIFMLCFGRARLLFIYMKAKLLALFLKALYCNSTYCICYIKTPA